ncbi:MAG: eL32 family ribosomal protein [Candidatus Diapherotrites archaeon]|nr:eL32 family ribosomal protein [Candidatus Diapherotrites archaeon]
MKQEKNAKKTANKAQKNVKTEKKKEMVKEKTEVKAEKKEKLKIQKVKIIKSAEIKRLQKLIKKKWKPTFRGRFGKRSIRSRHKRKWNVWRYPKGLDIQKRKEDGAIPNPGYRTNKEVRFLHPSGYKEVFIRNLNDLNSVQKNEAIRISAALGGMKRKMLIQKANEKGIYVLNR